MPAYKLLYKKTAAKEIQKLPPQIKKRLKTKLKWFVGQTNPLDFAEPLTKPADADYRSRVGVYRVLFDVEASNIVILHVQHRREVYRR
jgi:mRNA-degrading endonuclease RelE of RelBE toxin-antitoxin system